MQTFCVAKFLFNQKFTSILGKVT